MLKQRKHVWQNRCRVPEEKSGYCFCKSSNNFLYESYPKSQNYCYSKTINHILGAVKSKEFIKFMDDETLLEQTNLLKR
jgi:hypothetical protein